MSRTTTPARSETLRAVDARTMRTAIGCTPVGIEQTEAWEAFERTQCTSFKGVFLIKQNPSSQVQILRFPDNSTFSTALNRLHPAYPSDPRTSSPKGQGVKTS